MVEVGDRLNRVAFDTVAAIGALDGDAHEVFGVIRSVAVSEEGQIAILDGQAQSVAVFGPDGEFIGARTDRGEGPGELNQPWGLAWTNEGEILVSDIGNARFSRFALEGSGLGHAGSMRMEFPMEGLCTIDERVFATAYHEEGMIHRLGWEDERRDSFGSMPEVAAVERLEGAFLELARLDWTVGRLLCDAATGRVLEVGILNANVRLFTAEGETLWERTLDDVHTLEPVVEDGMFFTRPDEAHGAHVARAVLRWDPEYVLVQYERRFPPDAGDQDRPTLESRLIHLETGTEVARTDLLPGLEGRWGDRFLSIRNEPYPQVLILERSW